MRRLVAFNHVTADGYFASRDDGLDWVVPDDALDEAGVERTTHTDTMLFGRRTYEMFKSFWPGALDDSQTSPDPHGAGRRSRAVRAIAVWINEAPKLVFSKTLKDASWSGTRILPTFDPREIENMKKQPGKDIIVFGSGSIASQLTEHGLIDEYQFVVSPTVLGSGKSLLTDVSNKSKLDLLEVKPFPSGNVLLRYVQRR